MRKGILWGKFFVLLYVLLNLSTDSHCRVCGYGKSNFTPGLPGYGGITFAYAFSPAKKLHFRATALLASGVGRHGGIFYMFEPGAEAIVNISRIFRFQFGLSIPLVDKPNTGFEGPILNVGFQIGK